MSSRLWTGTDLFAESATIHTELQSGFQSKPNRIVSVVDSDQNFQDRLPLDPQLSVLSCALQGYLSISSRRAS